jgi:hypothetical protein
LANAPGRYALAMRERQFGQGVGTLLGLALLGDVACFAPLIAVVMVPFDWLGATKAAMGWQRRATVAAAAATLAVLTVLLWAAVVAATEFRIQRGTYPALREALDALADASVVRPSAKIALFERYSGPTLVALTAWLVAAAIHARDRRRRPSGDARARALGPMVWTLVMSGSLGALVLLVRLIASPLTAEAAVPPVLRLVTGAHGPGLPLPKGDVRAVLRSTDWGDEAVGRGMRWLGFGAAETRALLAADHGARERGHPLARPLPGDAPPPDARLETQRTGDITIANGEEQAPLVRAFLDLSSALFDGRHEPITVWHIALESFRADDVHALHSAAPAALTPFVNAAYESAVSGDPRAVGFRDAYQSGVRTAQAISGLWCGLGALPFQLALSRDLVELPMRCVPDVLRDAGFAARVYYGADARFEHLDEFARQHRVAVIDRAAFPSGLPQGAFGGVTDAALFSAALGDVAATDTLSYRFVLTLSTHVPFDLPEDLSPATERLVADVVRRRAAPTPAEDVRRLVTLAYTDAALAEFVKRIETSAAASRTMLVISADHATADAFLWDHPEAGAWARVPLVFYFPPAFLDAGQDREKIRSALHTAQALASSVSVSLNDVPMLLLSLLARHPALAGLPANLRWHTSGSAATSARRANTASDAPTFLGIDAASRVFWLKAAPVGFVDSGERSIPFSIWDEPLGPTLSDVTGALSALLRACSGTGSVSRCDSPAAGAERPAANP